MAAPTPPPDPAPHSPMPAETNPDEAPREDYMPTDDGVSADLDDEHYKSDLLIWLYLYTSDPVATIHPYTVEELLADVDQRHRSQ